MFTPVLPPKISQIPRKHRRLHISLALLQHSKYNVDHIPIKFEGYKSETGNIFWIHFFDDGDCISWMSVAVSNDNPEKEVTCFLKTVVFREDIMSKIRRTPSFKLIVPSEKYLCIAMDIFKHRIKGLLKENPVIFNNYMFSGKENRSYTIPTDYELCTLNEDDVLTVYNEWWKGDDAANSHFLKETSDNILNRPSVGIRHLGRLVAWLCIHSSGTVGQLHVISEFRGQELARVLLREMSKMYRQTTGYDPILYTHKSNTAAIRLFESEGFIREAFVDQKMFFKF